MIIFGKPAKDMEYQIFHQLIRSMRHTRLYIHLQTPKSLLSRIYE